MDYLYIKALHVIFIVCWFAAIFYIVRLFIYTIEAQTKEEIEKNILTKQFLIMQKKLWYIIGWPAMIGSFIFGTWLIYLNPTLLKLPWMIIKLVLVVLFALYHFKCQKILNEQKKNIFIFSSFKLRLFNELATLFLVAIVFLVIVKSSSGFIWGTLGLLVFAAILSISVLIYKRNKKEKLKN